MPGLHSGEVQRTHQQSQRQTLKSDPHDHVAGTMNPVVLSAALHGVKTESQGYNRGGHGQKDQDGQNLHGMSPYLFGSSATGHHFNDASTASFETLFLE